MSSIPISEAKLYPINSEHYALIGKNPADERWFLIMINGNYFESEDVDFYKSHSDALAAIVMEGIDGIEC